MAVSIARLTKPSSLSRMTPSIGRMTTLSLAFWSCETNFSCTRGVPSPSRLALTASKNEIQEERPADHQHEKREEQPSPKSSAGGRWRRRIVVGRSGRSRLRGNGRLRRRRPFGMGGSGHGIPRGPSVHAYVRDRGLVQGTTPFYRVFPIKQCPGTSAGPSCRDGLMCYRPLRNPRRCNSRRSRRAHRSFPAEGPTRRWCCHGGPFRGKLHALWKLFVAKGGWACLLLLVPDVLPTCPWILLCSGWSTWNTPAWKSPFTRPTGT